MIRQGNHPLKIWTKLDAHSGNALFRFIRRIYIPYVSQQLRSSFSKILHWSHDIARR